MRVVSPVLRAEVEQELCRVLDYIHEAHENISHCSYPSDAAVDAVVREVYADSQVQVRACTEEQIFSFVKEVGIVYRYPEVRRQTPCIFISCC